MNAIIIDHQGQLLQEDDRVAMEPIACLNHAVILGEAFTLRSYFNLLERYPQLSQINAYHPECLAQFRKAPATDCRTDEFYHLEFYKAVEMIGFPGEPKLDIFTSLKGISADGKAYSLESCGIDQLLDMSICLGKLKHVIFGDRVDQLEFETIFNLFEFVDGIAWELSFQRLPRQCEIRRPPA